MEDNLLEQTLKISDLHLVNCWFWSLIYTFFVPLQQEFFSLLI